MKISRTKSLVGLALTCLALTGSSGLYASTSYVISTFDSDLSALPYNTNFWYSSTNIYGEFTPLTFTNGVGNPGGAMLCELKWTTTTTTYSWQNQQPQINPWGTNGGGATDGLNLRLYDIVEFDVAVDIAHSMTNDNTGDPYGGIQVIAQAWPGWGNNTTNTPLPDVLNWNVLGTVVLPATNGWRHVQIPTTGFDGGTNGSTMSKLVFGFYLNNSIALTRLLTNHVLIDNVKFTSFGAPPTMQYVKAIRGLNMWQSGGQYDRNSFETKQSGSDTYMWSSGNFSGVQSYSMTIGSFPTASGKSNYVARLYLIGSSTMGMPSPDWNAPDVILMDIGVDSNNMATALFHWKTNSPESNGQLYDANAQIALTNPTPIGKWSLAFASDELTVTMTAPSGNSTNFTMGVHTNVPYIHDNFGQFGTVRFGSYANGANQEALDLQIVFTEAAIKGTGGGAITTVSNNWLTETTMPNTNNANVWVPVGTPKYYLVPTNNAMWVSWTVPDGGFTLQTNTVQPGAAAEWNANHGLPDATAFSWTHKGILVKPGDLPARKNLFFRLSAPKT